MWSQNPIVQMSASNTVIFAHKDIFLPTFFLFFFTNGYFCSHCARRPVKWEVMQEEHHKCQFKNLSLKVVNIWVVKKLNSTVLAYRTSQ